MATRADIITESVPPFDWTQADTPNGLVAIVVIANFNLSVSLPPNVSALLKRTPLAPEVGQTSGETHNAGFNEDDLLANETAPLASSKVNRAILLVGAVSVGNGVDVAVGDDVRVRVGDKRETSLMYLLYIISIWSYVNAAL